MSKLPKLMLGIALCSSGYPAYASVIVDTTPGTPLTASSVTDFQTPSMLAGSTVTAYFANNTSQTETWSGTGVTGTGWSLTSFGNFNTDTFFNSWVLSNTSGTSMTKLVFNIGPSDSVFDIFPFPTVGTPGSSYGGYFFGPAVDQLNRNGGLSGSQVNFTATFSNIVQIGSNPPVGDLYSTLTLDFGQTGFTSGGFLSGKPALIFGQDTDVVTNLDPVSVPEPASLVLWSLVGTGCIAARKYYRQRKTNA